MDNSNNANDDVNNGNNDHDRIQLIHEVDNTMKNNYYNKKHDAEDDAHANSASSVGNEDQRRKNRGLM